MSQDRDSAGWAWAIVWVIVFCIGFLVHERRITTLEQRCQIEQVQP